MAEDQKNKWCFVKVGEKQILLQSWTTLVDLGCRGGFKFPHSIVFILHILELQCIYID